MDILSIRNLTKRYEKFTLDSVSFSLPAGYIMGFVGVNGAGKTTTLKSMLNLVHADGGAVEMFGRDFFSDEIACKQRLGVVFGGVDYYPKKRLSAIAAVTKRFYEAWDDAAFAAYLKRFSLDPDKRIDELSSGMRVKFALSLALSHDAKLFLLDEPTSGLDPVSRDELLEIFQTLIEDGERSILFSTHITSDLDKCADFITYIRNGRIVSSADRDSFLDAYRLVQGGQAPLTQVQNRALIGVRRHAFGFQALVKKEDLGACDGLQIAPADLESIMIHIERGDAS